MLNGSMDYERPLLTEDLSAAMEQFALWARELCEAKHLFAKGCKKLH